MFTGTGGGGLFGTQTGQTGGGLFSNNSNNQNNSTNNPLGTIGNPGQQNAGQSLFGGLNQNNSNPISLFSNDKPNNQQAPGGLFSGQNTGGQQQNGMFSQPNTGASMFTTQNILNPQQQPQNQGLFSNTLNQGGNNQFQNKGTGGSTLFNSTQNTIGQNNFQVNSTQQTTNQGLFNPGANQMQSNLGQGGMTNILGQVGTGGVGLFSGQSAGQNTNTMLGQGGSLFNTGLNQNQGQNSQLNQNKPNNQQSFMGSSFSNIQGGNNNNNIMNGNNSGQIILSKNINFQPMPSKNGNAKGDQTSLLVNCITLHENYNKSYNLNELRLADYRDRKNGGGITNFNSAQGGNLLTGNILGSQPQTNNFVLGVNNTQNPQSGGNLFNANTSFLNQKQDGGGVLFQNTNNQGLQQQPLANNPLFNQQSTPMFNLNQNTNNQQNNSQVNPLFSLNNNQQQAQGLFATQNTQQTANNNINGGLNFLNNNNQKPSIMNNTPQTNFQGGNQINQPLLQQQQGVQFQQQSQYQGPTQNQNLQTNQQQQQSDYQSNMYQTQNNSNNQNGNGHLQSLFNPYNNKTNDDKNHDNTNFSYNYNNMLQNSDFFGNNQGKQYLNNYNQQKKQQLKQLYEDDDLQLLVKQELSSNSSNPKQKIKLFYNQFINKSQFLKDHVTEKKKLNIKQQQYSQQLYLNKQPSQFSQLKNQQSNNNSSILKSNFSQSQQLFQKFKSQQIQPQKQQLFQKDESINLDSINSQQQINNLTKQSSNQYKQNPSKLNLSVTVGSQEFSIDYYQKWKLEQIIDRIYEQIDDYQQEGETQYQKEDFGKQILVFDLQTQQFISEIKETSQFQQFDNKSKYALILKKNQLEITVITEETQTTFSIEYKQGWDLNDLFEKITSEFSEPLDCNLYNYYLQKDSNQHRIDLEFKEKISNFQSNLDEDYQFYLENSNIIHSTNNQQEIVNLQEDQQEYQQEPQIEFNEELEETFQNQEDYILHTNPPLEELQSYSPQQLKKIENFQIGNSYGRVTYTKPIDLSSVQNYLTQEKISQLVHIQQDSIEFYPYRQSHEKPLQNDELNNPFILEFYDFHSEQIEKFRDQPDQDKKFQQIIKQIEQFCKNNNFVMVDPFDPQQYSYTLKVSKNGFY